MMRIPKVPDIIKIGGLYRYAQKSVEDLTLEEPPVNENDRKATRLALDYYAILPELMRDAIIVGNGVNIASSDTKLEGMLLLGVFIPCYIMGSYLAKYAIDKGYGDIKKTRKEIVEERWEEIRKRL